jgi:hypothetical protein
MCDRSAPGPVVVVCYSFREHSYQAQLVIRDSLVAGEAGTTDHLEAADTGCCSTGHS